VVSASQSSFVPTQQTAANEPAPAAVTPVASAPTPAPTHTTSVLQTTAPTTAQKPVAPAKPAPTPTPKTTPVPAPATGQYADGTYTGSAADAYYGTIQVRAVVLGGKIADVQFLQYPNDRRTSIDINSQAMPLLKNEAIKAQSAQVDIVSGATDSSQAFRESLSSALTKAKA
jgi:uncharacterized protein with FMN-binding domain